MERFAEQASVSDEDVVTVSSFLGLEFTCLNPSEPTVFVSAATPFMFSWDSVMVLMMLVLFELDWRRGTGMRS